MVAKRTGQNLTKISALHVVSFIKSFVNLKQYNRQSRHVYFMFLLYMFYQTILFLKYI